VIEQGSVLASMADARILALTFASPWIAVAGAAAATAPIILHLLNRRRYRRIRWAAMRFLLESRRRNRRRLLLEDLILLALRCALIFLIAAAVARPLGAAGGFGGGGAKDYWFVLDDSASMGAARGSSDTFAAARAELLERVARVSPSDRLAICRTSDGPGAPWAPPARVADRADLIGRIRAMTASDTRGGLAETLGAIAAKLGESDNEARVIILSDYRRVDVTGDDGKRLGAELARLDAAGARLLLIDHGRAVGTNLTVERIRPLERHVIAALPTRAAVTIRNHGSAAAAACRMAAAVDDVELPVLDIPAIPAGESRTVEVRCVFPVAAHAAMRVRLPPDALAADNTFCRVFDPRRALAVLIVDGELGAEPTARTDSFYLQTALDPHGDAAYGVRPEIISPGGLPNVALDDYDLVVLAGVGRFGEQIDAGGRLTYPVVGDLLRYVRDGGGLVLFTGDGVDVNFYNDVLYDEGRGLLPLPIEPAVGDGRARDRSVKLLAGSVADAPWLTKAFGGDMAVLAGLLSFYRYTPALEQSVEAIDVAERPRVLARFADERSSPAIVERRLGEGRVVMIYTSVGARWHDWASSTNMTYLPVMNDMTAYLARPRSARDLNGPVGRPVVCPIDDAAVGTSVSLRTPAFPRVDLQALPVRSVDGRLQVAWDAARWAGVYELTYQGLSGRDHRRLIGRIVEAAEGDLAKADAAEVRAVAPSSATYLDRSEGSTAAAARADRAEYWRWFLAAAIVVSALEVWLAQKFGHYTG